MRCTQIFHKINWRRARPFNNILSRKSEWRVENLTITFKEKLITMRFFKHFLLMNKSLIRLITSLYHRLFCSQTKSQDFLYFSYFDEIFEVILSVDRIYLLLSKFSSRRKSCSFCRDVSLML